MDNPWANAWESTPTSVAEETAWEPPTKDQSWISSKVEEPSWKPPSPKWVADEPVWRPPTPTVEEETESVTIEEPQDDIQMIPEWQETKHEDLSEQIAFVEPVLTSPPKSPMPAIDTDAFGSFEAAQWGHGEHNEQDEEDPENMDEWEAARREKAKQDEYVPPEVLSAIIGELTTLSDDILPKKPPNHDTGPESIARDIVGAVDGLEALSNTVIPTSISLEPIPPFSKSWTYKKTADAVRLTRHTNVVRSSPLSRYLESKGSTAWEVSVKSRPELIHDDSDVLPAGWKVLDTEKKDTPTAPEIKRKSTSILSSFFGRNKATPTSPAVSARTSPVPSPRPSVDLGKAISPTLAAPTATSSPTNTASSAGSTLTPTPVVPPTSPSTSTFEATASPKTTSVNSPDVFPADPPPPSAVSRFLGRLSRTKSNSLSPSSMALSSDDLDFLSESDSAHAVPSALDEDDDPLGLGLLQTGSTPKVSPSSSRQPAPIPPLPAPSKPRHDPPVKPTLRPPTSHPVLSDSLYENEETPTTSTFQLGNAAPTPKQVNGGKGFGWVPPPLAATNPAVAHNNSQPVVTSTAPLTMRLNSPTFPPPKPGKRPIPVAIMSSASSTSSPSYRIAPPAGVLPPPPSGQVPLLDAPASARPARSLLDMDSDRFGSFSQVDARSPVKDALPPLPASSSVGPSTAADDDDFAEFQDSSLTSFTSAKSFSPTHNGKLNQSISSMSSASESSFFGGFGDSSMESNLSVLSGSVSVASRDDDEDAFSDFDDFLTAPPTSKAKTSPLPKLPPVQSSPLSSPATQSRVSSPFSQNRAGSIVDSTKGLPSAPLAASPSPPPPTKPISRQNTGSSLGLSRQNTGNSTFPAVIMNTNRQNTGAFPTAIMSSGSNRRTQTGTSKPSGGLLPVLPGPPGFGSTTGGSQPPAVSSAAPAVDFFSFGADNEAQSPRTSPIVVSPPPSTKHVDPLDLFRGSSGSSNAVTSVLPTSKGGGSLSAQDLSFFEGL